jgi:hypothetical protein
MITNIPVEMDASRVCDAIAKIGYSPASALMDIIDNSVTADATRVIVEIETDPDKTMSQKNNVITYRIIDNGRGMDSDAILNALKLGAKAEYASDSLSKYGMGLKAAGFSLGTKIQIVSKKDGVFSPISFVDKEVIRNEGTYVVSRPEVDEVTLQEYGSKIAEFESGTIVEITGCQNIKQDSAQKTLKRLEEQLGVVYYTFLTQEQNGLTITLRSGKYDVRVIPYDILFSDLAKTGFDVESYDMKSPYKVMGEKDREVSLKEFGVDEPMILEAVVFPRDKMKSYVQFTEEERAQVESYKVSARNSGFFIYRNKRLIRWGDDLGIAAKDDFNFRARIVLNTAHDDAFHVDVSKQRMAVPEEILARIEHLTRLPLRYADDARTKCSEALKNPEGKAGAAFNYKNQDLAEEEIEEVTGEEKVKTVRERKKDLVTQTEEQEKIETEGEPEAPEVEPVIETIPIFERVRYSDKVQSFSVWEAGYDADFGTYVRINRNHPFFGTVLARLEEGDESRQAMEAIFWAGAAAYNLTFSTLTDLDKDTITRVLEKFKKQFANNLDSWCSTNQDLYDND